MAGQGDKSFQQPLLDNDKVNYDTLPTAAVEKTGRVDSSVIASSFNLANTMIGLGTVTMPYAFRQCGLGLGFIFLIMVVCLSNYSYRLMTACSKVTRGYSYKAVAQEALGGNTGGVVSELCVIFYASCSCIAYIRVFADYLPPLFAIAFPEYTSLQSPDLSMILAMIVIFPLAAQKTLDSLRYFSYLAILGLALCLTVVILQFLHRGPAPDVIWWGDPTLMFMAFPLFSVANTGHHNVLRVYFELKDRDENISSVLTRSSIICVLLYSLVGAFGYATLGAETPDNILSAYTDVDTEGFYFDIVNFARLMLVLTILFTFPKPHFAVRAGIENVFFADFPESNTRRITITSVLCLTILMVAMFVPSISWAFDISGSSVGMLMVYILPSVFFLRLVAAPGMTPKRMSVIALMCIGFCFGSVALYQRFDGLADSESN